MGRFDHIAAKIAKKRQSILLQPQPKTPVDGVTFKQINVHDIDLMDGSFILDIEMTVNGVDYKGRLNTAWHGYDLVDQQWEPDPPTDLSDHDLYQLNKEASARAVEGLKKIYPDIFK